MYLLAGRGQTVGPPKDQLLEVPERSKMHLGLTAKMEGQEAKVTPTDRTANGALS